MKAVEFQNITKRFGEFYANSDISFSISKNDVHCILGENGAGKTTLMNILYGIYVPDEGRLLINGNEVRFNSPLDAISQKIGMVHQHFMLIDDFTILENVILGNEISDFDIIDFKKSRNMLNALIEKYSLNLNPDQKISELNISQQQKVEILKLLYRDSDILIFDEPTSVLSPVEIHEFIKIVNGFKTEGKTVIFITHKLKEVLEVSDCVTVLSRGKVTFEKRTRDERLNIPELSRAITGRSENSDNNFQNRIETKKEDCLLINKVSFEKNKIKMLDELNMILRKGEIYGLCGVEGNGQNEIVDILVGIEKNFSGEIKGLDESKSLIPDDRIKKGMIKEYNIGENLLLKNPGSKFITENIINRISEDISKRYDVRLSSVNSPMESLSGGNQQKVVFAREIEADNSVILLMHPTRGVDINATNFIHGKIIEERNKSKAILLISSDLDELINLSDRIGVIYNGNIIKEFTEDELRMYNENDTPAENIISKRDVLFEKIGKLMVGIDNEK